MVGTRPTPDWVRRLRQQLTTAERLAFGDYRCHVAKAHTRHRKAQLDHTQVVRIWADALDKLANASEGSPNLAIYLDRQRGHLETFAADLLQEPKTPREKRGGGPA